MTVPQTTPLILLSDYALATNLNGGTLTGLDATVASRLRGGIVRASDFIQRMAKRRFDERIDTRKYTALDERVGGALLGPYVLMLDDDFKAVTTVINGDGVTVTNYKLIHWNSELGVQTFTRIQLSVFLGILWRSGGIDPWEAIQVTGLVGYGGQWLDTGATVTSIGGSSLVVSSGALIEPGMMLKIDSEYIYADSVSTNTVTVARARNGSTSAAHTAGAVVYRWEALDAVRDLAIRLVQWKQEQHKSPVAGTVTVGDFSFPVDVSGLPKDLYLTMRDAGIGRTEPAQGV